MVWTHILGEGGCSGMDTYHRRRLQWYGHMRKIGEHPCNKCSTWGKADRKTTAKIFGYHQEGHESECNGGEGCLGSTGLEIRLVLWPQSTKTSVGLPDSDMWWSCGLLENSP